VALPWALAGGACAGVLAVLAVLGIHRQIRTRTQTRRRP
jgi:hypothetical protein